MPQREVEHAVDASGLNLVLACHIGEAHLQWDTAACEWAAKIREGDAGLLEVVKNRVAAGPMYNAFALRVLELLDGGR